jgi:hypothetical protein
MKAAPPRRNRAGRRRPEAAGRLVFGLSLALAFLACDARAALIGTCTIMVTSAGTITPNAALKTLSSANPGGKQATATIIASGGGGLVPSLLCSLSFLINCFGVTVVAPTGFTSAPTNGGTGVTFASSFDVAGSFALLSRVVLNGSYAFAFNLTATRASGIFPAGAYRAEPTIRCE